MRNRILIILALCVSASCYSQKMGNYTKKEIESINLFNSFMSYITAAIKNKTDITDTSHLKYILTNYVFINRKLDMADSTHLKPNELADDQANNFKREISGLYKFLQENEYKSLSQNMMLTPLHLSEDTFIYSRLTSFQKENTFAFYDKRYPNHIFGYILFVPAIKNLVPKSKIWSWTLIFKFGKFFFRSAIGEEGHEYLFEK